MPENSSPFKSFIAGGVGGIGVVLVGHPFDTVKVNLQCQNSGTSNATGFLGTISKIIKTEGVKGLYKGMATPLAGVSPLIALCFWGYAIGKKPFERPDRELRYHEHFIAGLVSGLFTTTVAAPTERIKCILQLQGEAKVHSGPWSVAKSILKEEGFRGIYRGTILTLARDSPGNGIFFLTYEYLLNTLPYIGKEQNPKNPIRVVIAGGCAGSFFWLYGIVPDVLKTRQQTAPYGKYKGVVDVFMSTIRNEGPKALFNGITPIMLRAFPCNAVCFLGVEYSMKVLNKLFPSS